MKIDILNKDELNNYIELLIQWSYINNDFEEIRNVLEKPYHYEDEIKKAILKEYYFLLSKGRQEIKNARELKEKYDLK